MLVLLDDDEYFGVWTRAAALDLQKVVAMGCVCSVLGIYTFLSYQFLPVKGIEIQAHHRADGNFLETLRQGYSA